MHNALGSIVFAREGTMKALSVHLMMYPSDMSPWPPSPEDKSGKRPCKASAGNFVTYDNCTSLNTSPQRNHFCKGCVCPWRICSACSIQHVVAADIRDINPVTGLCKSFHDRLGADTIRPSEKIEVSWRRRLSSVAQPVKPQIVEEILPKFPTEIDTETLDEYELIAREQFSHRRLLIMKCLADDIKYLEIAKRVKSASGSLATTIRDMGLMLGIDRGPIARNQKKEYVAKILAKLGRHMEEKGFVFPTARTESS